jgi:predicted hotdog family 3-hydroxylacyl-ACP dehydratase
MNYPPIRDLVPHEPPLLMLAAVTGFGEGAVTCEAHFLPDCPFVHDARADAVVLLELMAQTIASFVSLERLRAAEPGHAPLRLGYLVSAQAVAFHVPFVTVEDRLSTHATMTWHEGALGRFKCRVTRGDQCLAEGSLTVCEDISDLRMEER